MPYSAITDEILANTNNAVCIYNKIVDETMIFKRYGQPSGEFLGNATDSFESRALAPHSDGAEIYYYKPTTEIKVTGGKVAPWFGSNRGAEQFIVYKPDGSKYTIQELIDKDLLENITQLVNNGDVKID
ncbi:MAG: TNT domain-containing protein [Eubacteriales bacterium]